MKSNSQKPAIPWILIGLFLIIAVTSVILGILYYRNHKKQLFSDQLNELSVIADLKVRQIVEWRRERLADGHLISTNLPLVRLFISYFETPGDAAIRNDVVFTLRSLTVNSDYRNVLLIDTASNVLVSFPDKDTLVGDHLRPMIRELSGKPEIVLTDIHQTSKVSFIHLDLLIPVISSSPEDTSLYGFLAFRINPADLLYPSIQTWPLPSKTAEALLIREEGDSVYYFNEPRFKRNSEVVVRTSSDEANMPSAMAIRGIESTLDGVDYRGKRVIAAMKKVPESTWHLVAKIDRDEVIAELNDQITLIIIIIILFILTSGLFLGIIEWNESVRFYRSRYEAELDHLALVKHFDYILKYANDIIYLTDRKLNIIEANDRATEACQLSRNDLIGASVTRLVAPEYVESMLGETRMIGENGFATFETMLLRNDGSVFPVEISAREVEIEGVKYYQSICRDITERKNSEETLRESEERFRKIFEESPFGIAMAAKDLTILRANAALCNMTGYSEEELRSFTFRNFTHPGYIKNDEISLMKLVAEEIPIYHTEKRYIRKDRSIIWGSTTISILRNNNEEVQFFLAMVEDITSRKMAEEELEKSFALISATIESTADGILVIDGNGKIVLYNQKFADMWNIPPGVLEMRDDEAAINYVLDQLLYPDMFVSQVRNLYSEPETVSSDLLEFKDGRVFERYSQPHKVAGLSTGRVWSFRDITRRKKAEAELIAAKEKAEESDRLKTAFLHNVSHEIRTPMNAILGFSTLLTEPDTSETDRQQYIDIIFQSGSQLLSIINDIVDIANVESGQVKINIRELSLNASLRSLCEQFSYQGDGEQVKLGLKPGLPDDSAIIMTDSTKLIQILSNLISNARKFTKQGSIDFGYVRKNNFLEFFVKDTGIGISPEHHERIFDRFYQVDNAVSRKFAGTGLGLSICRAYVELLGGRIWLNSRQGEGTVFHFTIPYTQAPAGNTPTRS